MKTLQQYLHQDAIDSFAYNMQAPRKNPNNTFIGGIVVGVLSTLTILYSIFPLADYVTDTLLTYFMK